MQLRDYQISAIEKVKAEFVHHKRVILTLPTGAGKTIIACDMIRRSLERDKKILFLAHRKELIEQTSKTLGDIPHGIIMSGIDSIRQNINVASIMTLARREIPPADFIIVDECHLSVAPTWIKLLGQYPNAHVLGLTATPIRLDGKGLKNIYSSVVEGASVRSLTQSGYLVPIKLFMPSNVNMQGVGKSMGDYKAQPSADLMGRISGDIVKTYLQFRKKAIAFCCTVEHAYQLSQEFKKEGVSADFIHGSDPLRDQKIESLRKGDLMVLCNVNILSEGFDQPDVEIAILARPTQSTGLHLQQIGRVLRPSPGKEHAVILDHASNSLRHGLATDKREWSLDGVLIRDREANIILSVCQICFSSFQGLVCPNCKSTKIKRKNVVNRITRAEMHQVEHLPALVDEIRKQYYILRAVERNKGFPSWWTRWALDKKFGKPLINKFYSLKQW